MSLLKRILVTPILVLLTQALIGLPCYALMADANTGLLWMVKKQGRLEGYLFATPPVNHPSLRRMPQNALSRLKGADTLCFSVIPDPKIASSLEDNLQKPKGHRLDKLIGEPIFNELLSIFKPQGMTTVKVRRLTQWGAYYKLNGPWVGEVPADALIYKHAERMRRRTCSLESPETLAQSFESFSPEEQNLLVDLALQYRKLTQREHRTLFDAYTAQNLEATYKAALEQPLLKDAKYSDLFKRYFKSQITDRNPAIAKRVIEKFQKTMGPVSITLNTLHFPTKKGLLAKLRKAGYDLSPVRM